jgi:hypothetical protein
MCDHVAKWTKAIQQQQTLPVSRQFTRIKINIAQIALP